ncbi:MAG: nucleotidyltransferase domain-containing protein [Thermomonas sp.]|uniref:type VII toxin-antitoxin system MntA family adenylyltransferase antitoxin n=1 Tax=Thermomonas sp. TaxID=1971895 RepID=UPI0039E24B27
MSPSIARLQAILARQPGIRQAWLFGSAAADRAGYESDLDIAVELDHPLDVHTRLRLIDALAAASGRPIDLIDLKTAGEPLLGQILQHGKRLLGSDVDYANLIRRHVFDNEDFMPYVRRLLHERRQTWNR